MREQGTLADWNDDRGFGFIAPVAGGPRVFVHVSAFPRGQRPATNDLVTYGVGRDQRNRLSASDVLYVVPTRSVRTATRRLRVALATATLFATRSRRVAVRTDRVGTTYKTSEALS